ncbi:hypothetical protein [Microcystis aeruginosa]|jgi:hypothetical protein|uniref:Uncharacterized protein n=1 Tax=Microcystis viridis Mv_BB_P_19951000_S68D TaxID=2486270 RepID=A0A552HZ29_MICVR|nr:hypothetical protein [Microcystis aeruginosa]TRU73114.1 MAG: hypothetical protein EWV55_13580 [Microcystis viridis Mv_BB_P_19951000_S69]TRU76465.1 MAG: hypothetical protein EWV77_07125 [Microcystis viridis Mv_BB_P_19951000_S68D]TRU78417.1 MAG: hypothetical protein EWV47_01975 [Microcystis viridis Mv_BB_P_19951000_S68]TRU86919.1 MAG: hypothetical protein EWV46_09180 [Microcystis viridis Mv_BB_P_19951000_S69D]TYT68535.1 hypothetical protein FXO09_25620 [Microcystis aeruginosa KLA2]
MAANKITNINVKSALGTQVLTGTNGDYDSDKSELWVTQEGSKEYNGGPQAHTSYTITFTGNGSPQTLPFKGRFAGVGYEFK